MTVTYAGAAASALRDVALDVAPGEFVVVAGGSGSGKSTLLRIAAGLQDPTRGAVRAAGRVALLLQMPGDSFLHDRVGEELGAALLRGAGLAHLADRHPSDLSAASASGSRSRSCWPLPTVPPRCCWTSRPVAWTRPPRPR